MKSTPLPLTVSQMTTVGAPCVAWAPSMASPIWAKSWPSISRTSQPNARHLSASGSRLMTSSVRPSIIMWLRSTNAVRCVGLEVGGGHGRLPDGALVALAVAEHAVGAPGLLLEPGAQRHAQRHGEAVAERAGAGVHALDLVAVEVHPEGALEVVELLEQLLVEVALVGEHAGVPEASVPLAEHEPVALRPAGLVRAHVEVVVVQGRQHVGHAERPADVRAAGPHGDVHHVAAQLPRLVLQLPDLLR